MRLYELSNAILEAQHEQVDADQLDSLQMAFEEKAIACAVVTKNLRAESDAVDAEIKRLMKRKAAIENNRKALIHYIEMQMRKAGVTKVDNGIHKLRIQRAPMSVEVLDENRVPSEFAKIVMEKVIDKKGIINHVKETGEIPSGVDVHQREYLRIS